MNPIKKSLLTRTLLACTLAVASIPAMADGLSDLKQAIEQLNGQSDTAGILSISFQEIRGDDEDKKTKTGKIQSRLNAGESGLDMQYSLDILKMIEQETQAKLENEDVDTPTLNGAEVLSASAVFPILSSASPILDLIAQGEFIEETTTEYLGKDLRLLSFSLPLESFIDDKKFRSYVSKFSGSLEIIIDDNGVPLETRRKYSGKGSAYIFFSMKAKGEIISRFSKNNDRLIRVERQVNTTSSSTFNDREYQATWSLALL